MSIPLVVQSDKGLLVALFVVADVIKGPNSESCSILLFVSKVL